MKGIEFQIIYINEYIKRQYMLAHKVKNQKNKNPTKITRVRKSRDDNDYDDINSLYSSGPIKPIIPRIIVLLTVMDQSRDRYHDDHYFVRHS